MDAKCPTGGVLLRDKQDEKPYCLTGDVPETPRVASPNVFPLPQ